MVCTTVLSDFQQNQITTDDEINETVSELRVASGENWQVVERVYVTRHWFKADQIKKQYDLLLEVGGVLPFQQICGVSTRRECLCYMYGFISGLEKEHDKD